MSSFLLTMAAKCVFMSIAENFFVGAESQRLVVPRLLITYHLNLHKLADDNLDEMYLFLRYQRGWRHLITRPFSVLSLVAYWCYVQFYRPHQSWSLCFIVCTIVWGNR